MTPIVVMNMMMNVEVYYDEKDLPNSLLGGGVWGRDREVNKTTDEAGKLLLFGNS